MEEQGSFFDPWEYEAAPVPLGEQPPLSRRDILSLCDDLYDNGQDEQAHSVLDAIDSGEISTDPMEIQAYINRFS